MMQQQRGVYPMPAYGVVQSQQPGGRGGGRGGPGRQGGRGTRMASSGQAQPSGMPQQRVPQGGRGAASTTNPQQLKFNQQARNAVPSSQAAIQGGQAQPSGMPQQRVPQGGRGAGSTTNPQQLKFNQQARNAVPSSQAAIQGSQV